MDLLYSESVNYIKLLYFDKLDKLDDNKGHPPIHKMFPITVLNFKHCDENRLVII